ncbi:MAG: hypothetical protein ACKV2Q_22155 [Planctomycetaceae bacterium]
MVNAQIGAANGQLSAVQGALSSWRGANPGPAADREWDTFQAHKAHTQAINTRLRQWVTD